MQQPQKSLAIFDAFEILTRIEEEKNLIEGISKPIIIHLKDLQKEDQNSLYVKLPNYIPKSIVTNKNKAKNWEYGYNEKYNVVVISKTWKNRRCYFYKWISNCVT